MKKRIFILASSSGSLVNFRGELITKLIDIGYEVHSCAPGLSQDVGALDWLCARGVSCHDIPMSRTGINPFSDFIWAIKLRGLINKVKPDVMFSYTIKPVIWGTLVAASCKVPKRVALITGLGYAFTGEAKGKRKLIKGIACNLYRQSLRWAHCIFFQNPDDKADFETLGLLPSNSLIKVVNGSGVDTNRFAPQPVNPDPLKFLMIARLLADKGVREYAAAAKVLQDKYSNVEFHLVGGLDPNPVGLQKDEILEWVENGFLKWWGAQGDVRPFITDCSVYVLPSYREGTPRTVLEAMAIGRAVITTDAPGCRETVYEGDNGFLVPVRSVNRLVIAMEKFIHSPELIESMGSRSREIVVEKYDVHKVNLSMFKAMGID
ncbi:glycosyltransferase family 4 protein [Aliidiomarina soli]|uniref:Glycosyltransferase family 1 protein n=1 Tax=Aliidiomarina soli TaxID=1928574 RepID=A0A432WD47_9GAMM|nr:glycosyltransferase family 4 protein [Aliidiomarina soli]RUO30339.1 glycosyltransferase family 1 protein [Aliidiomarina soli]